MAETVDEQVCRFRWLILNPFVPWRRMVASFYHGSPTVTEWKVTLEPDNKTIDFWNFRFSLKAIKTDDPNYIVATKRLEVTISVNGERMNRQENENYIFRRTNWHTFQFMAYAHAPPQRFRSHYLSVEVEIAFPRQDVQRPGIGTICDDTDLVQLSDDMDEVYNLASHTDHVLNSTDPTLSYLVHSFIIDARWSNLGTVHHTITDDGVDTNISPETLWEILRYMYSGKLDTGNPNWGNPKHATEMFQVIERYKLVDLYRVFSVDEAQQFRTTRKDIAIHSMDFRLDDGNGQAVPVLGYSWNIEPLFFPELHFRFWIQFMLLPTNSYFQYSLESMSARRMHVQVNLEFKIKLLGQGRLRVNTVHQRDFTVPSNETEESGTCSFEGQTDELNAFVRGRLENSNMAHFYIRCTLHFSDGTSTVSIFNERNQMTNDLIRYRVLSDHMHEVLRRATHSDLEIKCPEELPIDPEDPYHTFHLHKAIFEARVPHWRAILGNVVDDDNYPNSVTLDPIRDVFDPVLLYIYTGKVGHIFERHRSEVEEFAERAGLVFLRNLIARMRLEYQD